MLISEEHSKTLNRISWKYYIKSFIAETIVRSARHALTDTHQLMFLTTKGQIERHVNGDLMLATTTERFAHPLGRVKFVLSHEYQKEMVKLAGIVLNEAFYINITFTHFHLYRSVSGCDVEKLIVTHTNKNTINRDEYCGHLPQWTQLIASNTVTICYSSSLPQLMCSNTTRKADIDFTYQIVHKDIIDESSTDIPYRLDFRQIKENKYYNREMNIHIQKPKIFSISTNPAGLHAFFQRLADIVQIWVSVKVNYHEIATIIPRRMSSRLHLPDFHDNMYYYDGPHYHGFNRIYMSKSHVISASSMSMTVRIFAKIDKPQFDRFTGARLTFYGIPKRGIPYHTLHLTGSEKNVNVWLTSESKACREFKSVMVLCALHVFTQKGRFIETALQKFPTITFDYPDCVYKGVVMYEWDNSPTRGKRPSHIHDIIPITVMCKDTMFKQVIYNRRNVTSGEPDSSGNKESCFSEQVLQNKFISSTNSILVMFYHYTPQGYSATDLSVHLRISVVTCQGLTLPCSVMSPIAEQSATDKITLRNYANWVYPLSMYIHVYV